MNKIAVEYLSNYNLCEINRSLIEESLAHLLRNKSIRTFGAAQFIKRYIDRAINKSRCKFLKYLRKNTNISCPVKNCV